jgi:hypothetical protein
MMHVAGPRSDVLRAQNTLDEKSTFSFEEKKKVVTCLRQFGYLLTVIGWPTFKYACLVVFLSRNDNNCNKHH